MDGQCGPRSRPRPRRTRTDGTRHSSVAVEHELRLIGVDALEGLAGVAATAESWAECLRLAAAAARLRDETGYRWRFAFEQGRLDAAVAAATEALGPETASAASVEGAALAWGEAAAYASRARGERQRPSHGWAALTPTELQVVTLVADGLTNPQIAERLLMGRATVKTHLDHVFTKTGLHSRTELATEYVRRQSEPVELKPASSIRHCPDQRPRSGRLRRPSSGIGSAAAIAAMPLSTLPSNLRSVARSVPVSSPSAASSNARMPGRKRSVTAWPSEVISTRTLRRSSGFATRRARTEVLERVERVGHRRRRGEGSLADLARCQLGLGAFDHREAVQDRLRPTM